MIVALFFCRYAPAVFPPERSSPANERKGKKEKEKERKGLERNETEWRKKKDGREAGSTASR